MTREIKFRAWNEKRKEYVKVLGIIDKDTILTYHEKLFYEGAKAIIEQYTGLKDKNGKDIYEGDVVKFLFYRKDCIGQVVFDFVDDSDGYYIEKHYGWGIYGGGYNNTSLGDYADDNMNCNLVEIIGNIHENPDLLK